jgi:hypothetical protein
MVPCYISEAETSMSVLSSELEIVVNYTENSVLRKKSELVQKYKLLTLAKFPSLAILSVCAIPYMRETPN